MKYGRKITTQFKKDFKKIKHDSNLVNEIEKVLILLADGEKLPKKYFDHELKGNYNGTRECHIKPDFLLVYKIEKQELLLLLLRLGSHSEIF